MFKKILFLALFLSGVLLFPSKVLAVSVSISGVPSNIGSDPFNVTVTVSGASAGTNYIRIDLYKDGSTNYFGDTYSGSDWYNGSDGTKYFPVTVESGKDWSGSVQARVGSPSTTEYDGQGSYKMRVRRYTSSGSQGGEDANESSVAVNINFPTSTPVPTSTPAPTNAPAPTHTPVPTKAPSPGPTSKPSSTPTKAPTPTRLPTYFPTPTNDPNSSLELGSDMSENNFFKGTPVPTQKESAQVLGISSFNMPWLFIALGLIFMVVCGILAYFQFGKKIFIWKKKSL